MLYLTDDELTVLTGYKVKPKRIAALDSMEIPYEINPRGQIVVRRDYSEAQGEFVPGEVS